MSSPIRTVTQLGAAIRRARVEQSLTQAGLAAQAGVSRRWLSSIESGGKADAELSKIFAVLEVLGQQIELADIPALTGVEADIAAWFAGQGQ